MKEKNEQQLITEEKKKYMREWRKNNKERVKIHNNNYWLKKAKETQSMKGREENDNINATS